MLAAPDRLALDVADVQALRAQAARGDKAALASAARQFEALLLSQLLKGMRQTRFSAEDDPLDGGEAMQLYRDLLDQQWAGQMSKGRGLGFADMILRALERQPAGEAAPAGRSPGRDVRPAPGSPEPRTAPAVPRSTAADPHTATDFIRRMLPHARTAARDSGVPAEFILAHAALESGWGRYEIRDAQGRASHNLFGIKAGRGWEGAVMDSLTTEYREGLPLKLNQRFRAYAGYDAAFADYTRLLRDRYGAASQAGPDAGAFSRGLAAGGYATDPAYADKLQAVIATVRQAGVQA
ncbi:MAG TPA: flagellar assembly peptidoglycan hydrolase FlgJ [Thiobacillaceae bacterium]|nr:flagellar assembly peptidoglycan hydrolase FlgJ [Thiobacillaceae bacterium]HNU62979.1 flagellar assembly peptidoglycan hydrolase FlgJ [Thiobacillaceae bacterium]